MTQQTPENSHTNRRSFLQTAAGTALAGAITPGLLLAGTKKASPAANAVSEFYGTLSETQKKAICFGYDHQLRSKVNANWHITKPGIGDDFYSKEQQGLIRTILKSITTEDGYTQLLKQMDEDGGGIDFYSVAMFGEPGKGAAQWELTGRHLTLRADGNHTDKAAFGGPIVYGHGESDPKQNMYHAQTKKVNEVFKALDAKHAEKALLAKAPRESNVKTQGEKGEFPGIAVSDLSSDQKELVEGTLKHLLAPFHEQDRAEVMSILKATGGVEKLHFAFYQQGDLNNDKTWDIWRVEGPSFVWHFRGAPHVHAYININAKANS